MPAVPPRATRRRLTRAAAAVSLGSLLALAVGACGSAAEVSHDDDTGELTVLAAASLRDVFDDLEAGWSRANPDIGLRMAFDGSNVLATQIEEGAPADVFVSADTERPARLAVAGLTAAAPVTIVRNAIAIVTPRDDVHIQSPSDLALPGVRIVAAGSGVPISRYATQLVARLGSALPDQPQYAQRVADNIVSREDNVRVALAKVELGEGDAAFVYQTDALASDRVRSIAIPADLMVSADYAAVQVSERQAAADFVAWLTGPEATRLFIEAGFQPVGA